jgi:hypothetical protein
MQFVLKLNKINMGFQVESIKNLLGDFARCEESIKVGQTDDVVMDITEMPSDPNELAVILAWYLAIDLSKFNVKKSIKFRNENLKALDEAHFFDRLTGHASSFFGANVPINLETFIPVHAMKAQDAKIAEIVTKNTQKHLTQQSRFHSEVRTHMIEVINNAFDHSQTSRAATSLCKFRTRNEKLFMDFCTLDAGIGMKKAFLSNPKLRANFINLSDEEIISQATDYRVSCNPGSHPNPNYKVQNGGIGLYYLREFIRLHNDSRLVIISGKGYYYLDSTGKIIKKSLSQEFAGTVVYFRTNLKQDYSASYSDLSDKFVSDFDDAQLDVVIE